MSEGWIKIHRQITESKRYFSEPFCRIMAWVDLLILANHADGLFYVRGNPVEVNRGQVGHCQETLGKRWKWSRSKVKRFLDELEKDGQIEQQKSSTMNLISIVNYDKFQNGSKNVHQTSDRKSSDERQTSINKNEKNDDNEKNEKNISFDEFWDLYDKKVGDKTKLEKQWNNFSATVREEIMAYIPRYKQHQPNKQYRKNPEAFFNQKGWTHEIIGEIVRPAYKSYIKPEDNSWF